MGGRVGGVARPLGAKDHRPVGSTGWPPATGSAIEPLGCSASVGFRNVLITL